MATTKFSVSAYTADGVTTDYLITWDYLDSDHIAVYVDGTPNYDPQSTYSFELINSTTVRVTDEFGNAVPSGSDIEIRRETPILDRAVTFNDGSALLAEDLNKNSDYLLYSMQEVLDTVEAAAQDGALAAQVATEGLRDETTVLRDTTEGYKNEALAARDTTQTYLATVDADATAADNHRIAAAASEAAALASETAAAASQAASATSEANAAASEAASAASEAAAAVSEANAATSAAAALVSENAAEVAQGAAETAQAAAEAALDEMTDLYLGAKTGAPTVDNDGNALQTGALYWNSTNDTMYVWSGSAWDTFNSSTGIADTATSQKVFITDSGIGLGGNPDQEIHVRAPLGQNADVRLEGNGGQSGFTDVFSGPVDFGIYNTNPVPFVLSIGSEEKLRVEHDGDYFVDGREQLNLANGGDFSAPTNANDLTPNTLNYQLSGPANSAAPYNGMLLYLSSRGLGGTHDDITNERAVQMYFADTLDGGFYTRVKQGTSGWHRWKKQGNDFAFLEGPTGFYGAYEAYWAYGYHVGTSLQASTSARGIYIQESGYYRCRGTIRPTGTTDSYAGIGSSGDRGALESRTTGAWTHDHSGYASKYTESEYVGWLNAGERITYGPASSSYSMSYGNSGYAGALIIERMS